MRESKIVAVDHVHLEAPLGVEESVRWFYADLCGLELVDMGSGECNELGFRSEHLEVRVKMSPEPRIEPVACRLTIRVEDLQGTKEQLEERHIPYETLTGVIFTDRRIAVCDPAGNRLELKHGWPSVAL